MKSITSLLFFSLFITVLLPSSASALSCVPPDMMVDIYADEDEFTIFTGIAGETTEHTKQKAQADDPNRQFDEGYTAQLVTVSAVYKGSVKNQLFVYHQKNSTWGYMCSSGPVEEGVETLFIISNSDGLYDLPSVVNTHPVDSEIAKEIIVAVSNSEYEPSVYEFSSQNWRDELARELKEMVFVMRVKLSEWRWWQGQ